MTRATGDLRQVLGEELSAYYGRPRRVERMGRRVSEYSTSFTIEELDLDLDHGEQLRLVFKDLSWQSLLGEARQVRPRFLYDPRREIAIYRRALAGGGLETAACYGAVVDEPAERYWLFLERMDGPQLRHVGDFDTWLAAARWLARLHTRFAGCVHGLAGEVPLLQYDEAFLRNWLQRLGAGGRSPALERVRGCYERLVGRISAMPQTLIHNEFYPSNVLVGAASGPARICPIDWELAAAGPGLIDVAALTAGDWTEEQRTEMLSSYRDALVRSGGAPPALARMRQDLDCCRLHLAVQWLGWAADEWNAPADQARDWLGEAVTLADRLASASP
jgi:Phosphotransferase enzyme family